MRAIFFVLFLSLVSSLILANLAKSTKKMARPLPALLDSETAPKFSVIWPLEGGINSPFGPRQGGFHYGVDIIAKVGTPVHAISGGRVRWAGITRGFGKTVVIDHPNELRSTYGHLSAINVRWGQNVKMGDLLGKVGNTGRSTGPHLHLEITLDGKAVDPAEILSESTKGLYLNDRGPIQRLQSKKMEFETQSIFEIY